VEVVGAGIPADGADDVEGREHYPRTVVDGEDDVGVMARVVGGRGDEGTAVARLTLGERVADPVEGESVDAAEDEAASGGADGDWAVDGNGSGERSGTPG